MDVVSSSVDIWHVSALPWRRCMELAWESFLEGSIPVGSVITNGHGSIVAEGRNRSYATEAGGGVAGTYIAHAEINALALLPPGEYDDHIIWSSLEPCFMCSAAILHSHVGAIRFAAADPIVDGVDRLPEMNRWVSTRWPDKQGPLSGSASVFGGVLPIVWVLQRRPDGVVSGIYADANRSLLPHARRLLSDGTIDRSASFADAFDAISRLRS
jgi:tRNA(adenine34) deaminase